MIFSNDQQSLEHTGRGGMKDAEPSDQGRARKALAG